MFLTASGITQDEQKKALLLHLGGKALREVYHSLQAAEDKYKNVVQKLDEYFKPKKNITYERYLFKQVKQSSDESSSNYVTRLRRMAETCEFADVSVGIKDNLIVTCASNYLRKKLLRDTELNLEKLLVIARSEEIAKSQAEHMDKKVEKSDVLNTLRKQEKYKQVSYPTGSSHQRDKRKNSYQNKNFQSNNKCRHCGDNFHQGHLKVCKANGKVCYNCGKKNNLSNVCFLKKSTNSTASAQKFQKYKTANQMNEASFSDTSECREDTSEGSDSVKKNYFLGL